MMMIAEQYINEAIRIRKLYLTNLNEIVKQEPRIMERKESFQKLTDEIQNIVFSDLNEVRKTMDINEKLMNLEKEIKDIQGLIQPYYDKIEKLKDDRDRLYLSIVEKYPNITTDQIKYEISLKMDE